MRSKRFKTVILLLAIILLLPAVLFVGFLQSSYSRGLMIDMVENYSPRMINGTICLGEISGSLLGDIIMRNVVLKQEGDTVLQVDEIAVFFRLMPLLQGRIEVDSLRINQGHLLVKNDSLLGLNWSRLLKPSHSDAPAKPSSISLIIHRMAIGPFQLILDGFAPPLPSRVDGLRLYSRLMVRGDDIMFTLDSLSAAPNCSWPFLKRLAFNFHYSPQGIALSDMQVSTLRNELSAVGNYTSDSSFVGQLAWEKPHVKEFDFLFPDLTVSGVDSFSFKIDNQFGILTIESAVAKEKEILKLSGRIEAFERVFSDSLAITPFHLSCFFQNVRPHGWFPALPEQLLLNGVLSAQGEQLTLNDRTIQFKGSLDGSSWRNIHPERFDIDASISEQLASAKVNFHWKQQAFSGLLSVKNWLKVPRFDVGVRFSDVDLSKWPGTLPIVAESGEVRLSGTGSDLLHLNAKGQMTINELSLYQIPIDSLRVDGNIGHGVASIDTMLLMMNDDQMSAVGTYHLKDEVLNGRLNANILDFKFSHPLVPVSIEVNDAQLDLEMDGRLDSLRLQAYLVANGLMVDSVFAEKLLVDINGQWIDDAPVANITGSVNGLVLSDYRANKIDVEGRYQKDKASVDVKALLQDSVQLALTSDIWPADTTKMSFSRLHIGFGDADIENADTLQFRWIGSCLWVDKFALMQRQNSDARVVMNGVIDALDSSNLVVTVDKLNSKSFAPFVNFEMPKAICCAALHLTGSPNAHHITLSTQFDSIRYNGIFIHRVMQSGVITNQALDLETGILNQAGDRLSVVLHSRHNLRQDSMRFTMMQNPTLTLESSADNLMLRSVVPATSGYQVSNGLLSYHLLLSGDPTNPNVDGFARIRDAAFRIPSAGVDFSRLNTDIRASGATITVDSLSVGSGKGLLKIAGALSFVGGVLSPVKSFDMALKANDFRISRRNYYDFTFDADGSVSTIEQNPVFKGRIEVDHAQLNMDRLMSTSGTSTYNDDALLVTTLKNMKEVTVNKPLEGSESIAPTDVSMLKLETVKGRLKLVIPRNTWLKGDNMGIELMGDLDIVKEGDEFEFFGNMNVNRGFYTLYGRKLNIVKGDMVFQGGSSIDPSLNLQAQYVFRTADRQKKILEATVGGKLSQPEINFELDGASISQGDAVGYLVFGKPFSELGVSNQQAVGQANAGDAFSGMLTNQLTKILVKELNLDVLEIDASENWENASFVVGKYITSNLFVIYQRAFGKASENDIAPESVTLEYELNRHLFFRIESGEEKSSGMDVILKIESKNR